METDIISRRFNKAAPRYDAEATVQARVALRLMELTNANPKSLLDVGCGTGLLTEIAAKKWPQAAIAALDNAPDMLLKTHAKVPYAEIVAGNAAETAFPPRFDLIVSSMMLHWLPNPLDALKRWTTWLLSGGKLSVALLIEGSFREWRDVCVRHGITDGLWTMPSADFAVELNPITERESITIEFPSALAFLNHLKTIGAATPRSGHSPVSPAAMRRLLEQAPAPFNVSYEALYLQIFVTPHQHNLTDVDFTVRPASFRP